MSRAFPIGVTSCALGGLVLLSAGCAGNINPNESVAQLLAQLAQKAQNSPMLNQLTVGDLVAGYQQFASQLGQGNGGTPSAAGLNTDQQQQLQALRAQLDSGQITSD